MNIDYFKALVAAARHRNITKAALELRTSQPSLSKQLRKLEEGFNVKLLTRSGMGVELTQDGNEFLMHAEAILERVEVLEKRFSKHRGVHRSPLKVGGGYAISASLLPSLLGAFKKRHPDVEVTLKSNDTPVLEKMLMKGTLDLIVTTIAPNNSDLVSEPCMPMRIVAVIGPKFSLPTQKALRLRDIKKIPLVIRSGTDGRGMTATFVQKLRHQGFKPKILMRCDSPEAIKTAVKKNWGIGILYEDSVKDGLAHGVFRRIRIADFPSEAQTYVVYHNQRPLSPSAGAFLNILRKRCRPRRAAEPVVSNMAIRLPIIVMLLMPIWL